MQKIEADRHAQEAQRSNEKTTYEQGVDKALVETIGGAAKSFDGVDEKSANAVRSILFRLSRQTTLDCFPTVALEDALQRRAA